MKDISNGICNDQINAEIEKLNDEQQRRKLLSIVSKGSRIAKVRTNGTAGYSIELTELKAGGGEVTKRNYTRVFKMLSTSIREAESWVEAG